MRSPVLSLCLCSCLCLCLILTGCAAELPRPAAVPAPPAASAEAVSFFGEPLVPAILPAAVKAERETKLAEARAAVERSPGDAEALIWLGRRTAYLGRYRESIEIFSRGIEQH